MKPQKNENGLFEIDIDGRVYEFEKWGADESTDVMFDLVAIVGKPLGMGVAAFFGRDEDGNKKIDKAIDPNIVGTIVESLTNNISTNKKVAKEIVKKLSTLGVFCDGKKITYDNHYKDRLGHLFKGVIPAAIEVQYGNFLEELLDLSGVKLPKGIVNKGP